MKQQEHVRTLADAQALGAAVASDIADRMERAADSGEHFYLGCPGGRSPRTTYSALATQAAERGLDLSRLTIVMMDDYVVRVGESWERIPADAHNSCRRFAREEIQAVLNRGVRADARVSDERVWVPDPADPAEYEKRLANAGGLDYFILASGSGDGHVAFNPPGSSASSRTRVVELAEQTRVDNLMTFPDYPSLDAVPRYGVTVGIATIAERSAAAGLILSGAEKRTAYERILDADGYDPSWPASVINVIDEGAIYVDRDVVDAD